MRRILFLVLVLSVFTADIFAAGEVNLWGGYTTVSMKDLNDYAKISAEIVKEKGKKEPGVNHVDCKASKVKEGFIIGADYLFDIDKTVKIGSRVAFLQPNKGGIVTLANGVSNEGVYGESKGVASLDSSLVPVMLGGNYNQNISEKFSLNGKLFFGCGLVKLKCTDKVTYAARGSRAVKIKDDSYDSENTWCFVSDISIGTQYLFTERFGLGFDLGYRFTPVTEVWAPRIGVSKLDFSGLTFKLSLSYKI